MNSQDSDVTDDEYEDVIEKAVPGVLLNPCDIARLTVPALKAELTKQGEVEFSEDEDRLDLYFRLCEVCGFALSAQTAALSIVDIRQRLAMVKIRTTGTKSDVQKRLTLVMMRESETNCKPLSQTERDQMLAANPVIAAVHYYERERALWEHIINGEFFPIGKVESYTRRRDGLQRGSFHTHSTIGTQNRPGEKKADVASVDDICDDFAKVATAVHGARVSNFNEFGESIDDAREALLKAAEEKPGSVKDVHPDDVLNYDAQRRPKVPYFRHPGHKRPPQVYKTHAAYKAHARANRNAYQFHRCLRTCYKYNGTCRFRFPRRLHLGKPRLCFRGAGTDGSAKKRVYIELERDHSWLNATQEVIQYSWGGNVDIQRIVDPKGSCSYTLAAAYYTTNVTKPENDALTKRMKASLARLPKNSTVAQRLTKVCNVMLNTLQVPIQMQWATILGQRQFPIVESSHECVDVIVVPPVMQTRVLNLDSMADDSGEGDDCVSLSRKRQLVESYMRRVSCKQFCPITLCASCRQRNECKQHCPMPTTCLCKLPCQMPTTCGTWRSLCFEEFAMNFFLSKSKDTKKIYVMGDYRLAQHMQRVAVCPIPHITSDDTNEQSAYGTLFLWRPFTDEKQLYEIPAHGSTPAVKASAVEVLAYLKREGLLSGRATRGREIEVLAAAVRAGFGAEGDGRFDNDPAELPEGDGVDEYEDFGEMDGTVALPAWATAPATGAVFGGAENSVLMLAPAAFLDMRNFAAKNEQAAKTTRQEALSVFDRGAGDGGSGGSADFGSASSDVGICVKERELDSIIAQLSSEQREGFDCVVHHLSPGSTAGHLGMHLAGAAGVGKSKLLMAIVLWCRLQFGSNAVEVTAQTNAAARLVDGHTHASVYPSAITMRANDEKEIKRKTSAIQALRTRLQDTKLLILEEHSLTSSEFMLHIHDCLCAAFPEKAQFPFAAFHV